MIMHMVTFLDRRLCAGMHTSVARKSTRVPLVGRRQQPFGDSNANCSDKVWSCFQWLYWPLIATSLLPCHQHRSVMSAVRTGYLSTCSALHYEKPIQACDGALRCDHLCNLKHRCGVRLYAQSIEVVGSGGRRLCPHACILATLLRPQQISSGFQHPD
ncbi:hypothetical protein P171DRAFT_255636 [Karstenula rhodostoma CBS 690.94]|uniref:Uncharacterized protein n=1 Tax=Karstenula rhodostoma CBS 690.94 TaxID=1392251 RepID=A0A9P4UDE2_9PLEO|nr:hypothetical protein P171DRAFT_255636 [Karstenula rhodostoma CBS 690.94]